MITVSIGLLAYEIIHSIKTLKIKMLTIGKGDSKLDQALVTGTEFVALENGLNILITQREEHAQAIARENNAISASVIRLIDATDQLSKQDFTIEIPVGADITGNVSDALNIMTHKIARVMTDINKIAA
ncbi:hypothetical protein TI03_07480, partial [Achromatium sp. WMS1]